ncbi:MAG TPA: NB-ARC domain-containing protein, partial [Caldilineaceae bacterium]|nr:NB-ARC domain-containing protein [Caldilineaceae bacterium]
MAFIGQRSAAIAQYHACRQVLSIEFGAEPDPATTALYEQVKTGALGKATPVEMTADRAIHDNVDPKGAFGTQVKGQARDALSTTPAQLAPPASTRDWGEAPAIGLFHGRQAELDQLAHWLVIERSRLVTVVGMGGMGKTALAARLTRAVADRFTVVIWRSLLNAPPLVEIIGSWLQLLAGNGLAPATASLDLLLNHLFELLRKRRCLLVLDNAESIMQGEVRAGYYRPGYEGYGQLFQRFGAGNHQSCLLITSREQPHIVARLAQTHATVHTLQLMGLTTEAGASMIKTCGIGGTTTQMARLIDHYSGNPLALMLVAETIQELYAGDLATFLREGAPIFDDIRNVLDEHIARLLPLERDILLWLAIERQPLSTQRLAENLQPPVPHHLLLEALVSLRRRSLLEKTNSAGTFALQNVVTEYVTHFLIEQIAREVEQGELILLKSHALLMAQAKAYVRQAQTRLILQPIADRLRVHFSPTELAACFKALLASLRTMADRRATYAGGNLLNLLLYLDIDPATYDFSQLAVWQADLQRADLPGLNLAQTDLRNSVFAQDFIGCHSLSFAPTGHLLAGGMTNGEIHLWRLADHQLDEVIKAHATRIWAIVFSPDGQMLASGSKDCTVRLWDIHTGQCRHTLSGHTDWVRAVAFHPNGRLVASGGHDQLVRIWDVRSGRTVHVLRNHTGWIMGLAFSPDGARLASAGTDQTVRLWDVETGEEQAVLYEHSACTVPLCFSPDSAILATASYDQTICLWDLSAHAGPNNPARPRILTGHKGAIYVTAFSTDGRYLFSAGHEELIYVWDVATGQRLHLLAGHSREVNALAVHPTGTMLATSETDTSTVYLWEIDAEPRPSHLFYGYRNWANAVAFHPHLPLLASAGPTEKVHLWDALTGQPLQTLRCENDIGLSLAFGSRPDSEDATLARGSTDHSIWVWPIHRQPAADQRAAPLILRTAGEVRAVAFSDGGRQ